MEPLYPISQLKLPLKDLNFVVIVGPSGSGKSNLAGQIIKQQYPGESKKSIVLTFDSIIQTSTDNCGNRVTVEDAESFQKFTNTLGDDLVVIIDDCLTIQNWFQKSNLDIFRNARKRNILLILLAQNHKCVPRYLKDDVDAFMTVVPNSKSDLRSIFESFFPFSNGFIPFQEFCRSVTKKKEYLSTFVTSFKGDIYWYKLMVNQEINVDENVIAASRDQNNLKRIAFCRMEKKDQIYVQLKKLEKLVSDL